MRTQKVAFGAWREASEAISAEEYKAGTHYMGTCQKCGAVVAAVKLALTRIPFGGGEVWACKGGCND